MKYFLFFSLMLVTSVNFSQKKVVKNIQTNATEINVYTTGLDNLILENSNSDFVEVYLYAESYDEQLIKIEQLKRQVNIKFDFEGTETREVIFRKFITKRLQRANAIVKIPKGKKVYVFGENVDIESKDLKNDLAIYIENGIVKLNEIKENTVLKLYSGNVYASIKKTNIEVISKNGKIEVDAILYENKYQSNNSDFKKELKISSLKANIFLNKIQ